MKPVEKLNKILKLEAEKYQDRAVFGGLVRYADTWVQEARAEFGAGALPWIEQVAERLRIYSGLDEGPARQKALASLVTLLREEPESPPPPEPEPPVVPSTPTSPPTTPLVKEAVQSHTGLDSEVTVLRGVGPRQAERLAKLGIHTIGDLLYFFPRHYDDYSHLETINRLAVGQQVTVIAQVRDARVRKLRGGRSLFKVLLSDDTGTIEVTWFNQPYLAGKITRGKQIVVSGRVDEYLGRLCFKSPEWEPLENELLHTGRLVPVYPLTEGVSAKWLRRLIKRTIDYWSKRLPEHLPAEVCEEYGLMDLETAVVKIHFPDDQQSLDRAIYRLAFDELFILQVGLLRRRRLYRSELGRAVQVDDGKLTDFVAGLPYDLTAAQRRAVGQIVADLGSEQPMNRLLQGDVGCGKTVVAAAAMVAVVAGGGQVALMAPTEILAEQHHQTINRLLSSRPGDDVVVRCLTGSVTGEERETIVHGLADGTVDVVVGTHALIQEGVVFKDLVLAVIDEQHRFGVNQRGALRRKGYNPHLLVMTATPIPRSLELTIWGHLDVSVIDEMPPGREPVVTRVLKPAERERAYAFVRSQIEKGRQAFFIYPLVEESENVEARAAVEEYERLQKRVFSDLCLGLLHGRMKAEEKEATMAQFAGGELDVLVATSVVEVGIDVPNATVVLIEGADRFGLAQLHQFRGRVGRSEHDAFCLLVSGSASLESQERLQAVETTTDGFALAQKDLEMRGPGEFLGTRQSGFLNLRLADVTDLKLVETARQAAQRFFATDPELADPDHRLLARWVARLWSEEGETS